MVVQASLSDGVLVVNVPRPQRPRARIAGGANGQAKT
jgi:hypothetical protein